MSTLAVVEEILRETEVPMSVREIVERAGVRLPSKSKTPDTVVARDLAMDIKRKGDASQFARTSPGRYTLRTLAQIAAPAHVASPAPASHVASIAPAAAAVATATPAVAASAAVTVDRLTGNLARKPAVAATPTVRAATGRDSAEGGGYAG